MAWTDRSEVPVVEGGQLRLVEALDDRQHRGVDKAHAGVRVPVADLPNARVVRRMEVLHGVRAGLDVGQEREQNARIEELTSEPHTAEWLRGALLGLGRCGASV